MKREGPARAPLSTKRLVAISSVVVALGPVGWSAAHLLASRELPPPLWDESDLPAPPAGPNGFAYLRGTTASMPPTLLPLTSARSGRALLAEARAHQEELRAELRSGSSHVTRDDVFRAFEQPGFADDCQVTSSGCHELQVIRAVNFAMLVVLDDALGDRSLLALDRVTDLVRSTFSYLRTARSLVSHVCAMTCAMRALTAADAVVRATEEDAAPLDPFHEEALVGLEAVLVALHGSEIHTRRAVVFEHLFANEALRTSGPSSFEKLAYDRRQTALLLQRSHRALMEHARHPTAPPAPAPSPTEQPGWFVYNPVGKQLIEAMIIPAFHDRIRAQHRDGQRLLRDRDALVRRIRALRAGG